MKDRLFQLLGIEHDEETMVSMLLIQSVFLGIFFGAFDISAHSLFLSIFDEKMMARGYVVSGFAGIILTTIYTWLQARLKFKNFAIINLIFVTILTLLLWIALLIYSSKVIIFVVFIMLGPLNILAMLGFWGTTGRLFTLRQGKRLFGLVDAGLIIGVIVSCYTIPVLLALNFKSHNILLISVGSILFAAVVQVIIGRKFTFAAGGSEKQEKKKSAISMFREDSYIRIMSIFIALSVMTAFFIQYSFMAVTREQYPLEADMARFLGLFTGSMMIFTLLIKLLVFSYLIKNYGLKTCLAISPFLVAGFTVLAIAIGMLMGYTPASTGGFIIFFLILAVSRLFSKALKDSIESPSFKVVYQTVDESIRYEVQSGIDGTVNEISALSSGLLLAGLGALTFVRLIHFSWVLIVIIIIWIFVALRLYSEYRKSIRKSLESIGPGSTKSAFAGEESKFLNKAAGLFLFKSNYYNLSSGDLSVIDSHYNKSFLEEIISFAGSKQDLNLLPALRKIAGSESVDELIRHRSAEVIDQMEETKGDPRKSKKQNGSPDDEKLINARKSLAGERLPQTTEILRLLKDNNIESKRYAIYIIGKFRMKDMLPEVCSCLSITGLESDSASVIGSFGTEASEELIRLYLSLSGNTNVSKSIIRILGKSATQENMSFLFSRLWSNSRQVKEVAGKSLLDCGFRTNDEEKDKLFQLVSDIIGMVTWNIAAQSCLAKSNDTILLEVVRKETTQWNSFLFNILSVAYDPLSLSKIRDNLSSGTVESVNYALEMIDIVIDDAIKPKLVSVVDAVSDDEKLKNLHHFYPGELPVYEQLIEDIINRDYNLISIWAKASTLRRIKNLNNENLKESVIALLFSPERIIREEAARLLTADNKNFIETLSSRIPDDIKSSLASIISGQMPGPGYLYEKVRFLSHLFKDIPEDELLYPASGLRYAKDIINTDLYANQNHVIWNLLPDHSVIKVFILKPEQLKDNSNKFINTDDSFYYSFPINVLYDYQNLFPERADEMINYLDNQESNPV